MQLGPGGKERYHINFRKEFRDLEISALFRISSSIDHNGSSFPNNFVLQVVSALHKIFEY